MEYSKRTVSKDSERDIVIGLITSEEFIKAVKPVLKKEHMTLPYSKMVLQWAYDYHDKYAKPLNTDINLVFEENKKNIRDQATIESLEVFINRLSERFENSESYNVQYHIDKTIAFAKNSSIDLLIDKLKMSQLSGDLDRAEAEISNFKRVEKGLGTSTSVWCDIEEAMKVIHADDNDIIVKFPGDLGKVIRPLTTDDFVAFIGSAKRGKSWHLIEVAILASLNKKNVLFLTLEMPAKKLRERIFQRVTGEATSRYDEVSDTREIDIPYFDTNFESTGKVFKKKTVVNQLSSRSVIRKMRSIRAFVKSDNFRIITAPSNSFTASMLDAALDNLEHYDGFIPDMIVVDYCDIMGIEKKSNNRDDLNVKWEALRTIGQQRHVLMVTASHTNKSTLMRDCRADDVVEDSRRLNHLTLCIGINQLQEDKDNGVQRLAVLIDRVEEFNPSKEAVITQCLTIGNTCLDSRIKYKGAQTE